MTDRTKPRKSRGMVRAALIGVVLVASAASVRAQDVARAHLTANRAGITYSIETTRVGAMSLERRHGPVHRFTRLCTAPCDVTVSPGVATLLLEATGGGAQTVAGVAFGAGDTTLVAHYESREAIRTALWGSSTILLASGLGAFIGCLADANDPSLSSALAITSLVLSVLGIVVAALVELAHDEAGVSTGTSSPAA